MPPTSSADILHYHTTQSPDDQAILEALAADISSQLSDAEAKV